jgi:hypothetical protein
MDGGCDFVIQQQARFCWWHEGQGCPEGGTIMRRLLVRTAASLCLVPLLGLGLAHAGKPSPLPELPVKGDKKSCGSHGTTVDFVDSPREAARRAKKEEKLVFVLHVSGNFEDPRFT